MIKYKRAILAYLVGGHLFVSGCGSGTSADDMRRHAIRRPSAEKELEVALPPADVDARADAQSEIAAVPKADASSEPAAKVPASNAAASKSAPPQAVTAAGSMPKKGTVATQVEAIPASTPPAEPLTPAERRERTASNLNQIGEAWHAYYIDKQYFPGPIKSGSKEVLLSWRVELLPYLGMQALYDEFHLEESWDSSHNMALLDKIPGVFQSPERFDTKTNYLALVAGGETIYQERRKVSASDVEDGIENTLALVEVDDEHAVPWTQPTELPLTMAVPLDSLGDLRENGLFVVWSDGMASWIDKAVDRQLFEKACTIDAGDGFRRSQIAGELAAGIAIPAEAASEVVPQEMVAAVPENVAAESVPVTGETQRPTLGEAIASLQTANEGQPRPLYSKAPIPSASELKVSRDLLRDLFQEDYTAAKTEPQRLQLARKMLDHLTDLGGDIAGQYALLEIVKQISIQAGSVEVALDATDQMTSRFELQEDALLDTFEKLARTAKVHGAQDRLLEEADEAFDNFVVAEQYESAERLSQLAVSAASQVDQEDNIEKFTTRRQWASEAKDLQEAAEEGLAALEKNPEDPQANNDVGKFLCLIKGDWQNGLVILANGNDRSLKRLAEMELGDLSEAARKLELADLWWREAESSIPAFQATMQARAKHWYEQALPGIPAGLVRIRVERRVEEIGGDRPKS